MKAFPISHPCLWTHIHIYTHMHRHTAPPEYLDTMTGSTLAKPPLYLPIHPGFLSWGVGDGEGAMHRCRRASWCHPATAEVRVGGEGGRICLGRDGERSLILQPSAAFVELRGLEVSQFLTCGRFYCFTSQDAIFGLCKGKLVPDQHTRWKTNFKSISCHPAEWDRWWQGGSHRTSGMPVAASVVI